MAASSLHTSRSEYFPIIPTSSPFAIEMVAANVTSPSPAHKACAHTLERMRRTHETRKEGVINQSRYTRTGRAGRLRRRRSATAQEQPLLPLDQRCARPSTSSPSAAREHRRRDRPNAFRLKELCKCLVARNLAQPSRRVDVPSAAGEVPRQRERNRFPAHCQPVSRYARVPTPRAARVAADSATTAVSAGWTLGAIPTVIRSGE
jgi:hypothetical protein